MRVLHLSHADQLGGAAIAAQRLHQGLRRLAVDSQMLVQTRVGSAATVHGPASKLGRAIAKLRPTLDQLPLLAYRQRQGRIFSCGWGPSAIGQRVQALQPTVLNLHWVAGGFLPIPVLAQLPYPLVWTLHDMWAFTGGCHYNEHCDRYQQNCGQCPQLGSGRAGDLSRWNWRRKARVYPRLDLTVVCPSQWLASCARASALLQSVPVTVIPNGLDCEQFRPLERGLARQLLRLPAEQPLILFGAMSATRDPRKGFPHLQAALRRLQADGWGERAALLVFGASAPVPPVDLGLPVHYLGRLHDDIALALVYSAADVFVAPSVQDNLPNTVLEAIACGTPTVAFRVGGMPDLITHHGNGYLATPFESDDLARGIAWVLGDRERQQKLATQARQKAVQDFSLERQAQRYLDLYRDVCQEKGA